MVQNDSCIARGIFRLLRRKSLLEDGLIKYL